MTVRKKTVFITAAVAAVSLAVVGCSAKAKHWHEHREAMKNSVVLINTFEVPQGKEAEALASWQRVGWVMTQHFRRCKDFVGFSTQATHTIKHFYAVH